MFFSLPTHQETLQFKYKLHQQLHTTAFSTAATIRQVQGLKTNTFARLLHHGWALMVSQMFLTKQSFCVEIFLKKSQEI